jgi:small subunit ribosomal protein S17
MTSNETKARTMVGKIVSDKMQKTIVVMVERIVRHHKYGKILRRKTKIHAHDENQLGKIGDIVRICEVRPISKTKCWKLVEVIS